jgi:murein DD-endopeptidase MepM/ murein hydrolase activator NlpD
MVMRGETLFTVAERTRSPLKALIRVNNLTPPYRLSTGQTLKLPPLKVHVVGVGETFPAIATRYSIDARSLAVFNNLALPVALAPGQRIILPPLVVDRLTGLEPQDLLDLLANEISAGRQVTGDVPGQILASQQSLTDAPPQAKPPPKTVLQGPASDGSAHRHDLNHASLTAKPIVRQGPHEDGDGIAVKPRPAKVQSASAMATPKPKPKPPPAPSLVSKSQSAARISGATAKPNPQQSAPLLPSTGSFIWPVVGPLAETFGTKRDLRTLDGIEIEAPEGAPFRATDAGTVVYVGNQLPGYGWLVLIRHANNLMSAYAYAQSVNVRERQNVTKGQIIGLVGTTGRAPTPRLHFQIRHNTKPVDPLGRLPRLPRLA